MKRSIFCFLVAIVSLVVFGQCAHADEWLTLPGYSEQATTPAKTHAIERKASKPAAHKARKASKGRTYKKDKAVKSKARKTGKVSKGKARKKTRSTQKYEEPKHLSAESVETVEHSSLLRQVAERDLKAERAKVQDLEKKLAQAANEQKRSRDEISELTTQVKSLNKLVSSLQEELVESNRKLQQERERKSSESDALTSRARFAEETLRSVRASAHARETVHRDSQEQYRQLKQEYYALEKKQSWFQAIAGTLMLSSVGFVGFRGRISSRELPSNARRTRNTVNRSQMSTPPLEVSVASPETVKPRDTLAPAFAIVTCKKQVKVQPDNVEAEKFLQSLGGSPLILKKIKVNRTCIARVRWDGRLIRVDKLRDALVDACALSRGTSDHVGRQGPQIVCPTRTGSTT